MISLRQLHAQLTSGFGAELHPDGDDGAVIGSITHDSRDVIGGALFCCVPGDTVDGHDFAEQAVEQGAMGLLVERFLPLSIPQLRVDDVRMAMGPAASAVYGNPSGSLDVIGVTGTNGKTTSTQLLKSVAERCGLPCGTIGTLSGARTTPEAPDLQRQLRAFAEQGDKVAAIEVSSHALALHRVAGTRFAAAVFTNLGRDHLDFHSSIDDYFQAKATLFDPSLCDVGVINIDDPWGVQLCEIAAERGLRVRTFRLEDAGDWSVSGSTSHFEFHGRPVELSLAGAHNISNALAVLSVADELGWPLDLATAALGAAPVPPGRFEFVSSDDDISVIVDYAHTPDALHSALKAARQVATGRVLCVFGCGGDRDRQKRPEMGAVAHELADVVVITSDNPRSEDPAAIIREITAGLASNESTIIEQDRATAIALAIDKAAAGDVVLIAGKGHETYQVIGSRTLAFDDRAVAREVLAARRRAAFDKDATT